MMVQADELSIPTKQAVRIEYPGYIRDKAAALLTLGQSISSYDPAGQSDET